MVHADRDRRRAVPRSSRSCSTRRPPACTPSRGTRASPSQVVRDQARPARLPLERARRGQPVVGYGAPGKGNTLLNHCGIRTDLLRYTVDRARTSRACSCPGTHIPIHAPRARSPRRAPTTSWSCRGTCAPRSPRSWRTCASGAAAGRPAAPARGVLDPAPPRSGTTQRAVGPAGGPPRLRVERVAAVEDPRCAHDLAELVRVELAVLAATRSAAAPRRRPSTASCAVSAKCRSGALAARVLEGSRVGDDDSAPRACSCAATSRAGESRTSSLSGLNAAPSTATRAPPAIEPPQTSTRQVDHPAATPHVDRVDLPQEGQPPARRRSSSARAMNARMSFGRQPPPKPRPGVEELASDPLVVPDRVRQLRDVAAGGLAQLGHRVDEGDLGREERVGRDLDQLARSRSR